MTGIDTGNKLGKFLKYAGVVLLSSFAVAGRTNDRVILRAEKYTVTGRSVVQGKYTATALSPDRIRSTYRSDYRVQTPSEIQIKFSINGGDNEAPAGRNHLLVLSSPGTRTFTFGKFGNDGIPKDTEGQAKYLRKEAVITIRLDMREVVAEMDRLGYFTTFNGQKISKADFKGVYVAGNTLPLSWDFGKLPDEPRFTLRDSANSGIYKVTLIFKKDFYPGHTQPEVRTWTLSDKVSGYPRYISGSVLSEALYNLSLEEMIKDIRPDGAFMAGEMWPGVWTRDVSYSGLLSLAIIDPDAVKSSLLEKVSNDRIIQDTGTGGSWPVSSDRMVWTLAAWEVYKVTGDKAWLKKAYEIARNSAMDDLHTLVDPVTGMFHGESTFLDWREQTYPRWMDPKDIFQSEDLGTNAVQYETYMILAKMSEALGNPPSLYLETAERIKNGINKYLWIPGKGYYGQYLYGPDFPVRSQRSESLGEALCVLFGIAGHARAAEVVRNTPVTEFGITCIYPQIPGIPPYHNNAVWPFVQSYWAWASSEVGNMASVSRSIGAVYRAAAFFLTNRENMVASTGDLLGTQISSDRQLWSVAGDLAIVYRVLFGLRLHSNSLSFTPCVPHGFGGKMELSNVVYRKSVLSISITGYGDRVKEMTVDGKRSTRNSISADLIGKHSIAIVMTGGVKAGGKVNLRSVDFSPATPQVKLAGSELQWKPVKGAAYYSVYMNGHKITRTSRESYGIGAERGYREYQVMAVAGNGMESFLSKPLPVAGEHPAIVIQAESGADSVGNEFSGYTGTGYVRLDLRHPDSPLYKVTIQHGGLYAIDIRYANGSGPINTDNKCAVRTLEVDHRAAGPVVMPQRGAGDWESWGYSNPIYVRLSEGAHVLSMSFNSHDSNMNGKTNTALVDAIRLTMISKR